MCLSPFEKQKGTFYLWIYLQVQPSDRGKCFPSTVTWEEKLLLDAPLSLKMSVALPPSQS